MRELFRDVGIIQSDSGCYWSMECDFRSIGVARLDSASNDGIDRELQPERQQPYRDRDCGKQSAILLLSCHSRFRNHF